MTLFVRCKKWGEIWGETGERFGRITPDLERSELEQKLVGEQRFGGRNTKGCPINARKKDFKL